MPTEGGWPVDSWRRAVIECAAEVGIALPWLLVTWLDYAVACHRWTGWRYALSLGTTAMAAGAGWHLVRRAALRYDDAGLSDLLGQRNDA